MTSSAHIVQIPRDTDTFGVDAYEITACFEDSLKQAERTPGHFSIKVDPLLKTDLLHKYGFYYCGTSITPFCRPSGFKSFDHTDFSASDCTAFNKIAGIIPGAFLHGRFHRDFNISPDAADLRYERWARQLYDAGSLLSLSVRGKIAGFFGYSANKIVLHALAQNFRGKGFSKYLWSAACKKLFKSGHEEIVSSVSAANISVINLYSSLGFRFRQPLDVYHRFA